MVDKISKEQRSKVMARIHSRSTLPEMRVRSLLHKMSFRFRLHRKDLPGKPDIVLPKYKTVVMVHGCFWHQHPGCKDGRIPSSNRNYWEPKLARNVLRDRAAQEELKSLGWTVLVIWECETEDEGKMKRRLKRVLEGAAKR